MQQQTPLTDPQLDLKLAVECANAFASTSGLGCVVSDLEGNVLHQVGYNCNHCLICQATGRDTSARTACQEIHNYGMAQSQRFGGKYIYFCPMGLTCFVSPIMGSQQSLARITVGPLLMVEREDYINLDLRDKLGLTGDVLDGARTAIEAVPYVSPERVSQMSTMLFMSAGFLNNVSMSSRMLDTQASDSMQGHIGTFLMQLKGQEQGEEQSTPSYPFDKERELLQSIAQSDKTNAQRLLNEILGHIFFASGGDFGRIKSRVYELLVLTSRAAVDGGADPEYTFDLNHKYIEQIADIADVESLCFWLADVMNRFTDIVFRFSDVKHVDVMHKAVQYIRNHSGKKLSLDQVAAHVYLSPSYFSKVFNQEMGCNFSVYLNRTRIENSKKMLLKEQIKLIDIAELVGFDNQSYFSKVFKKIVGVSPYKFRECKGRIK